MPVTWNDQCQLHVAFGSSCQLLEVNGDSDLATFSACGTTAEVQYGRSWCTTNAPPLTTRARTR